jgi:hypothetical protein
MWLEIVQGEGLKGAGFPRVLASSLTFRKIFDCISDPNSPKPAYEEVADAHEQCVGHIFGVAYDQAQLIFPASSGRQ